MFKLISFAVLALTAEAKKSQWRPLSKESAPWHKTPLREPTIDFPHDYKVPNFGVDHDVIAT